MLNFPFEIKKIHRLNGSEFILFDNLFMALIDDKRIIDNDYKLCLSMAEIKKCMSSPEGITRFWRAIEYICDKGDAIILHGILTAVIFDEKNKVREIIAEITGNDKQAILEGTCETLGITKERLKHLILSVYGAELDLCELRGIVNVALPETFLMDNQVAVNQVDAGGSVYLIQADLPHSSRSLCKIGMSRNPDERIKAFSTEFPIDVKLLHKFQTIHYHKAEKRLHEQYADKRIKGEWFNLSDTDIAEICSIKGFDGDKFIKGEGRL